MTKNETPFKATESIISEIYDAIPGRIRELIDLNGLGEASQAEQGRYMGLSVAQYRAVTVGKPIEEIIWSFGVLSSI